MAKFDIIIKNENDELIAKSEYKYPYLDYFWLHECLRRKIKRMLTHDTMKLDKKYDKDKDHFTATLKIEVIEK